MNKKVIMWIVGSVLGGGICLTILGLAMQQWISTEVGAQLAAAGVVPASTVTALDVKVTGLDAKHEKDITRVESKAERIAQILMEE